MTRYDCPGGLLIFRKSGHLSGHRTIAKLTVNRLPDEVLLETFYSYRQSIDQYDYQWRKEYAWFNITHVCRRWHAVMFASSSRLDLNIIVGPKKPSHIKKILSGHFSILSDCWSLYQLWDVTGGVI